MVVSTDQRPGDGARPYGAGPTVTLEGIERRPRRGPIAELIQWVEEHLHESLSLEKLAQQGHLSVRTLTRRFQQELGMSPMAWLTHRRIERARELLESTDLPVEAVATRCGFPSAAALRSHFRKLFSTTPSAYRERTRTS